MQLEIENFYDKFPFSKSEIESVRMEVELFEKEFLEKFSKGLSMNLVTQFIKLFSHP